MIIYFFKDRSKERVNFGQLIDEYFDKLENTVITSNDDEFVATLIFLILVVHIGI